MQTAPAQGVGFRDLLYHFKQASASANAKCLEGRGDCQADRLFRAAGIGYDQIGPQGVYLPFDAFDGRIEGFEVNSDIISVMVWKGHFFRNRYRRFWVFITAHGMLHLALIRMPVCCPRLDINASECLRAVCFWVLMLLLVLRASLAFGCLCDRVC